MGNRQVEHTTLLDSVVANTVSAAIDNTKYKNSNIQIATSGSATGVVKVLASDTKERPDFTAAASISNAYDTVAVFNLSSPGTVIDGDTGVVYAGTDAVERVVINDDNPRWLAVALSGYSAGTFLVTLFSAEND